MKHIEPNDITLQTIGYGDRIREERLRLKLNQEEFGALGGVARPSQSNYESEQRVPDLKYLANLCEKVDVMYILTGNRGVSFHNRAVNVQAIQSILSGIESWASASQRQLTDHFRAELVALFLQHLAVHGTIDSSLIRSTLRLVK